MGALMTIRWASDTLSAITSSLEAAPSRHLARVGAKGEENEKEKKMATRAEKGEKRDWRMNGKRRKSPSMKERCEANANGVGSPLRVAGEFALRMRGLSGISHYSVENLSARSMTTEYAFQILIRFNCLLMIRIDRGLSLASSTSRNRM